jgi:endonuclease G
MKRSLLSLFLLSVFLAYGQQATFNYLPTSTTNEVVKHTYYTLSYSERDEQAEWVAYELTAAMVTRSVKRSGNFRADPDVTTGSATPGDYKNSGYDRGHLASAADMAFSPVAMSECFYMSNMSPMAPSFNRGIWEKLEEQVRTWATEYRMIYIVTGGILKDSMGKIGRDSVTVPRYFYKIVMDNTEPDIKAIAFILPNAKSEHHLYDYAVTIDSIESLTGIDFFPELPDSLEKALESHVDTSG